MEITNATQARQWLAAWHWQPRAGILGAAIDGMIKCVAIAESQGAKDMAEGYRQALAILQAQATK